MVAYVAPVFSPGFVSTTKLITAAFPGINPETASAWLATEQGYKYDPKNVRDKSGVPYNNPLGVTDGHGNLLHYPDVQTGVNAAANLVNTAPFYNSLRTGLVTGTAEQQAGALVASPWNRTFYSGSGTPINQLSQGKVTHSVTDLIGQTPIGAVVGGAGDVAGNVAKPFFDAASTPFLFIGVILVGITFLFLAGFLTLGGSPFKKLSNA